MTESRPIQLDPSLGIPFASYARGQRVGAKAALEDVRIHKIDADLLDFGAVGPFSFELAVELHVSEPTDSGAFLVVADYHVSAHQQLPDDAPEDAEVGEEVLTVKVGIAALYASTDLPSDLTVEEIEAFATSAGALALHPYARELVASTTQRFGLPPLLLPPLKVYSETSLTADDD